MEQLIADFIEQLIADFTALSYAEKVLTSAAMIYIVVTSIYIYVTLYQNKRNSILYRKKKKWSLKKFLGFR